MAQKTKEQRRKQRKAKEQRKKENRRNEKLQTDLMSEGLFQAFVAYWFDEGTDEDRARLCELVSFRSGLSMERTHESFTALFLGFLGFLDPSAVDEELLSRVRRKLAPRSPETLESPDEDSLDLWTDLILQFGLSSRIFPASKIFEEGLSNLQEVDPDEFKALKAALPRFLSVNFAELEFDDVEKAARVFDFNLGARFDLQLPQILNCNTSKPDEKERIRRTEIIGKFVEETVCRYLEAPVASSAVRDEDVRAYAYGRIVCKMLLAQAQTSDSREEREKVYQGWPVHLLADPRSEETIASIRKTIEPEVRALGALSPTDFYRACVTAAERYFCSELGTARRADLASAVFVDGVMDLVDPTLMKTFEDEEEEFFKRAMEESDDQDA